MKINTLSLKSLLVRAILFLGFRQTCENLSIFRKLVGLKYYTWKHLVPAYVDYIDIHIDLLENRHLLLYIIMLRCRFDCRG
jgi:hypothetical protein